MKRFFFSVVLVLGLGIGVAAASADAPHAIAFDSAYALGSINGQNGWTKTGPYDANVVDVSRYPSAVGYGFGTRALQISDAVTSGSFSDQTFSPGLARPAREGQASNSRSAGTHFEASFRIGTTRPTEQSGLHMSVSPDDGNGNRMSYLSFVDQADGVHVFFTDATFEMQDIATLDRAHAHSVRFAIDLRNGPGNDLAQVFVDGRKAVTGTTWEDYYRYAPEQAANGNHVPQISKLLFREGGEAHSADAGQGFLVDGVDLSSR